MHKKAGIVIGLVLVTLAIAIHFIFGVGKGDNPKNDPKPTQGTHATNPPKVDTTPAPSLQQPVQQQTQQPQPQNQAPVSQDQPSKVFSEFTESEFAKSLGEPKSSNKEIMTVSSKKVVLMDSDSTAGSKTGKQLVFAVSLQGDNSDLKLTAYLNKDAYDTLNVGDKLTVDYEVYENVNKVKFPVIRGIQK